MDNIKNDLYYVKRMLTDIRFVMEKTAGLGIEELKANEVLCDSALFRLIQISESSLRLTPEFKAAHGDIPWQAIKGMRNRIVHEYGEVNLQIVYETIMKSIPQICERLEALL